MQAQHPTALENVMSKFKTVLIALLSLVGLAALVFGASKWIDQNN